MSTPDRHAASTAIAASAANDAQSALGARACADIAAVVGAEAGIQLGETKRSMMQGRLARRLRALGLTDFDAYARRIAEDAAERTLAIEALTTNHTGFFREPHHFRHLARVALPELVARAFAGGRLRLWSSASSTGEEPYTIAMTLMQEAQAFGGGRWLERADVAILATDLNAQVLEHARRGRYAADAREAVPEPLRSRFMHDVDGELEITAEIRAHVSFRQLNLLAPWPMRGPFDIIFCRNVAIYFDEPTRTRLWSRFADLLAPAGWLYIGHSERIGGEAAERLRPVGQTIYRLGE